VKRSTSKRPKASSASRRAPAFRVGIGYDAHRLAEGRRLVLGGVEIPHERGLLGHSDADVLLHAVMDALLGAAGLGDIGCHFPNTDEQFRDASSVFLLVATASLLDARGFRAAQVDATVIAEAPRIAEHIPAMRAQIAETLELDEALVTVKATTQEGLGWIGRREGIAAIAVAQVESRGRRGGGKRAAGRPARGAARRKRR
jgi:2-C-methyl-D-erythritol 2,4-cyclodiphosphate synthase